MVKEEIEKLKALQEMDTLISEWEEEIDCFPAKKEAIEKPLKDISEKNNRLKAEYKKIQVQKKENELELESVETEIKKLKESLNVVKTNKEYSSILSEIETLKKKQDSIENLLIELLDKDALFEKQIAEIKGKNIKLQEDVKEKVEEEDKKIEAIKLKLQELQKKRDDFSPSIKKDFYEKYERIRKSKRDSIAICRLENGSCSGCRVFVPTFIEEKVKEKKELVNCENCSRILF